MYKKEMDIQVIRVKHSVSFTEGVTRSYDIARDLASVPLDSVLLECTCLEGGGNCTLVFLEEREDTKEKNK